MPPDPAFDAKMQMPGNLYRATTLRNIGMASIGSAGVFAALAGLKGLANTWNGARSAPPILPTRREFVTVPVRRRKLAADAGPLAAAAAAVHAAKQADGPAPLAPGVHTAGKVLDFFGGLKAPDGSNWGVGKDTWWNHGARSVTQMPWAYWAGPLAIGGAGVLGYKGVSNALEASRRRETDSELAEARRQYEQALVPKRASADAPAPAPDPLDRLYDRAKEANWLGPLNGALGGYALAATALAGGAGVSAYNWARSGAEDKAVAEALKQRRERMFAQGPAPIVATADEYDDPSLSPPVPARLSLADLRDRLRAARPPQPAKLASAGQAAVATLQRFEQNKQQVARQTAAMLGLGEGGGKPAAKPAEPAPPRLPSVVNNVTPAA